jgi:hypothetical protein
VSAVGGPELWEPTPGDLVSALRDALISLTPVLDRCRIPWRAGESYDQWDAIAEALFDAIVVDAIRWSGGLEHDVRFSGYGFEVDAYAVESFVEVLHPSLQPGQTGAFQSFATVVDPMDAVDLVVLDQRLERTSTVVRPFGECGFVANLWLDGSRHREEQLHLDLP